MILDPIRAAVAHLYATTPPPVTVYGVQFSDGIEWCDGYADALLCLAENNEPGAQLVTVTGRVRSA